MFEFFLFAAGAAVMFMVCGPMMFGAFRQPTKADVAVTEA